MAKNMTQRFKLGRLVATAGVDRLSKDNEDFYLFMLSCLSRHVTGDWGEMCQDDRRQNDKAVKTGQDRIFSAYEHESLPKVWIITEWDRSVTTILFPEEY